MKVLFSNPPWWEGNKVGVRAGSRWPFLRLSKSNPSNYVRGDYTPYPFFLGAAASYVKKYSDAEVYFLDSIANKESYEDYYGWIESKQFDYIFIEISDPSEGNDLSIIKTIDKLCPKTKIVLTGPPVAQKAQSLISNNPIYACIKGEYEKGAINVINGKSGIIEFDFLTEQEMNDSPYPWYDFSNAYRYWDNNPKGQIFPQAQILSSRGCPFKCIFCVWPATMTGNDPDGTGERGFRQYSESYLYGFISHLKEKYKFRSIYFDDDTFNLGRNHVEKVCSVMEKIKLPWSCMCRADTIPIETWEKMKESGCFGVKIGIESGSQYVIDNIIKKKLNLDKVREVIKELKRLNFTIHGTFTTGLPGETEEQKKETLHFIKEMCFTSYQLSTCMNMSGTPLNNIKTDK